MTSLRSIARALHLSPRANSGAPAARRELRLAAAPASLAETGPKEAELEEIEPEDAERHLACLRACLDRLPAAERRLALLAHRGGERERAEARRRLAAELGISADDLRLSIHRLRRQLADCCSRCLVASHGPLSTTGPREPGPASGARSRRA